MKHGILAAATALALGTPALAQQQYPMQQHPQQQMQQHPQQQMQQQRMQQQTQQGHQQGRLTQKGDHLIVGTVVDTRNVTVRGNTPPASHTLLRLVSGQGKEIVVDLGVIDRQYFNALNLQKGDRVVVMGRSGRINDRPIIFARYIAEFKPVGRTMAMANR